MPAKLDYALDLARRGLRVFPLIENGRTPAFAGWQDLATTDTDTLVHWFAGRYQNHNIGVATGRGVFVVDADCKRGAKGLASLDLLEIDGLEPQFTVRTMSGGRHVYLTADAIIPNSVHKLTGYPDIDIRGDGGFVVAPGTTVDGATYEILADGGIPPAPQFLVDLATRAKRVRERQGDAPLTDLDDVQNIARAILFLEGNAPTAIAGAGGNDATYRTAAHIKDYGLSAPVALDLMADKWNARQSPPWDYEELARIVEHVYAYGTSPPGNKSAAAEFDAVELATAPATRRGLYRVGFDEAADLATTTVTPHLIEDIIDQHGFAVLYGPSNSGKTFLALSWAYHIATGEAWFGHATEQGTVLYIVAEGGRGINKRLAALRAHYKPATQPPLDIVPCPVDLRSNDADVKRIVKLATEAAEEHGSPLRLIVVDTLSRALAAGDENASTDMGAFIQNIDKLRAATQACVLVVHHTGKNVASGARGWSGLRAAIDSEIEVQDGGLISFEKQRDHEKIAPIGFVLHGVDLGAAAEGGKHVTSCVLLAAGDAGQEFDGVLEVPPAIAEYYDSLLPLAEAAGARGVSAADWDTAHAADLAVAGLPARDRRTLKRYRSTLAESGWVRRIGRTNFAPADAPRK